MLMYLNSHQVTAIANADAHTNNAHLPTYTELFALTQRLAYADAGDLLTPEDYRNIARNVLEKDKSAYAAVAGPEMLALIERVARLNRDAGEIGPGMLASLVDEAKSILENMR